MNFVLKFTTLTLLFCVIVAQKSLYDILQIHSGATSEEIKKSFRKLSIKYHPDRNPGDQQVHKLYLEMQRAFEILMDVSQRSTYDLWGEEGLKQIQKNPKPKGGDYRPQMFIPLELFYTGGQEVFNFRRGQICKHCKGTGDLSATKQQCPLCKGSGKMHRDIKIFDKIKNIQLKCKLCKGIGIGSENTCPKCRGEKIILKPRDLKFTVQRGMGEGDKINFKGESEQGFQFYPGDVIVTLRQNRHPIFTRDGNNLRMSLTISVKDAILGFQKTVKHLDNRDIQIVGNYNIQDGEQIILKNEGMPVRGQPNLFGDLLVKIKINFPKKYTDDQIDEMKQIFGQDPQNEDL